MRALHGGFFHRVALLALVAGALAIGCGGSDHRGLASLAPPDAPLYVEAAIPSGDQAETVDALAGRFGVSDPRALVTEATDRLFAEDGLDVNFADDVEPWLGDEVAVFVRSFETDPAPGVTPDFAAMVEVDDVDAAGDFLQRLTDADPAQEVERSYDGTDYLASPSGDFAAGVVDGYALVVGTEMSFKLAVDAADGESLSESEEYTSRTDELADDPLATAFFEPAALVAAAEEAGGVAPREAKAVEPLLAGALSQPVAATLSATEDSASIDLAASTESTEDVGTGSALLDGLPADSWFAAAIPDLGPTLQRTVDRLSKGGLPGTGMLERRIRATTGIDLRADLLTWLGDAAVFVQGTAQPAFSAGLIAQTSDRDAPRRLLDAVRVLVERESGLRSSGPPQGADSGFSVGLPGLGGGAEAGVVGDELVAVVGSTVEQALHPSRTLATDGDFQTAVAALGDDLAPVLYVELPSFLRVARMGDSDGSPDYAAIAPYVDELGSLIAGTRVEDGLAISRGTVTLAPN
jgi:hypothetical protein